MHDLEAVYGQGARDMRVSTSSWRRSSARWGMGEAGVICKTTDPGVQLIHRLPLQGEAGFAVDVERRCDRPRGSVRRWLRSARPHGG